LRGWEELVYGRVGLGYLLSLPGSASPPAGLDVGSGIGRYQSSFLRLFQVLHLDGQVCEQRYAVPPLLLVPLRDVLVFELVGILPYVLAA